MRQLTFKGFLTRYVRGLSYQDTNSLYKLTQEAATSNPRLVEPLFLYALYTKNLEVLLRAAKHTSKFDVFASLADQYNETDMDALFENNSAELPDAFRKTWRSYQSIKNRTVSDNQTKDFMRRKIVRLQESKRITNYRIYKSLELNPGNVNAWLKTGASEKVSLETARRILQFVQQ